VVVGLVGVEERMGPTWRWPLPRDIEGPAGIAADLHMVGRHGIVAEANPVVFQGFVAFGLPILVVGKVALVVLLGAIIVLLARDRPSRPSIPGLAATITVFAVIGGLVGGISNVLAG
jgi:hypothetical protein